MPIQFPRDPGFNPGSLLSGGLSGGGGQRFRYLGGLSGPAGYGDGRQHFAGLPGGLGGGYSWSSGQNLPGYAMANRFTPGYHNYGGGSFMGQATTAPLGRVGAPTGRFQLAQQQALGLPQQVLEALANPSAGDASDPGAGSVAGGSTTGGLGSISGPSIGIGSGGAFGTVGFGGPSFGTPSPPSIGLGLGLTGNVGLGANLGGPLGGQLGQAAITGLGALGIPTGVNLLGLIAPAAAAALGPVGLGIGAFGTAVSLANAIAGMAGVPTATALAQEGHPAGLAALGQLTGLGISPDAVFSAGPLGGHVAALGPNSPLGPQGSYIDLDPSTPGLPGLSMGGIPGSPSLAGLGLNTGQPAPAGPTPAPGPTADDPSGGELGDPGAPTGVIGGLGDPEGVADAAAAAAAAAAAVAADASATPTGGELGGVDGPTSGSNEGTSSGIGPGTGPDGTVGGAEEGSSGADGVSGGDTIICSELHRQGLMPEYIWEADGRFGRTVPARIKAGYHRWARPVVWGMQRSTGLTRVVAAIALPWSQHMAHEMGAVDLDGHPVPGSLLGHALMSFGWILSGLLAPTEVSRA